MTEMRLTTRVPMMPKDTNAFWKIFGGVIMGHMDAAGGYAARKHTGKHCVTRAVKGMEFTAPIDIGDMVAFYTQVVAVGKTSVTVAIKVISERWDTSEVGEVGRGEIVYVAIDENQRPVPIEDQQD